MMISSLGRSFDEQVVEIEHRGLGSRGGDADPAAFAELRAAAGQPPIPVVGARIRFEFEVELKVRADVFHFGQGRGRGQEGRGP